VSGLQAKRVLVIGAHGFIGKPLVEALHGRGAEVHAVSRGDLATTPSGATWWKADVASPGAVERVVDETQPHVVYHLATAGGGSRELDRVRPTFRDDVTTTVALLLALAERGVERLVLTGSMEEPSEPDAVPSSPYAAAKWAACGYARMFHALYDLPVVILRPFMTYGPGQKPFKLIPYVISSLQRGEVPRVGTGSRPVDWVYLDDMVDAFVRAGHVSGVVGETLELGSGQLTTVREVVELLYSIMAADGEPAFGSAPDRSLEVVRAAATIEAARILGWRATTPLQDGLRKTVEWYRRQPA
jgi:nucleoside-diphosphate-sugar epimerase